MDLDELAFTAFEARIGGLKSAQVNKVLEFLESHGDVVLLQLFLARQVSRKQWDRNSASRLFKILEDIAEKSGSGEDALQEARRVLGLFKWLFEASERSNIWALKNKYIKHLGGAGKGTPRGFYQEYLKACLGLSK